MAGTRRHAAYQPIYTLAHPTQSRRSSRTLLQLALLERGRHRTGARRTPRNHPPPVPEREIRLALRLTCRAISAPKPPPKCGRPGAFGTAYFVSAATKKAESSSPVLFNTFTRSSICERRACRRGDGVIPRTSQPFGQNRLYLACNASPCVFPCAIHPGKSGYVATRFRPPRPNGVRHRISIHLRVSLSYLLVAVSALRCWRFPFTTNTHRVDGERRASERSPRGSGACGY